MRRFLLAAGALALAVRFEAAAEPEAPPTRWRVKVTEPSLVKIDRSKVPGMAGKPVVVTSSGDSLFRFAADQEIQWVASRRPYDISVTGPLAHVDPVPW